MCNIEQQCVANLARGSLRLDVQRGPSSVGWVKRSVGTISSSGI